MDWLWLGLAAYLIGVLICVREIKVNHPHWHVFPCVIIGLAWPHFAIRRGVARLRQERRSQ
jgi:predicted membrane channel-forming protein YqfA (hemolysin III family)